MRRFRFRADADEMTCHQAGAVLQAYLDGELDDLATRRVGAHLAICRRCGLDLDVYTRIKGSLARRARTEDDEIAFHRLRTFADDLAAGNVPDDAPVSARRPHVDE